MFAELRLSKEEFSKFSVNQNSRKKFEKGLSIQRKQGFCWRTRAHTAFFLRLLLWLT